MTKWTDAFIAQCLDGIPKDKYRKRAQAELTDHLLTLVQDLQDAGSSPEEAQTRAVELMGAPEELNVSFREEWVRTASDWQYYLPTALLIFLQSYMTNAVFRWFILMPLFNLGDSYLSNCLASGNLLFCLLFSVLNVLPGLCLSSYKLHKHFSIHPKRKKVVFCWFMFYWLLEVIPYSTLWISAYLLLALPLFWGGHLPMVALMWDDHFNSGVYIFVVWLAYTFFALLYCPRPKKAGDTA